MEEQAALIVEKKAGNCKSAATNPRQIRLKL
jgi:hypothetical protein